MNNWKLTNFQNHIPLVCSNTKPFFQLLRSTFDAVPDFTPLHLATALWARAGEDALKQHEVRKTSGVGLGGVPGGVYIGVLQLVGWVIWYPFGLSGCTVVSSFLEIWGLELCDVSMFVQSIIPEKNVKPQSC